jgi:hypothetical protein
MESLQFLRDEEPRILRLIKNVENKNIEGSEFFKGTACDNFLETNHL